MRWQAVCPSTGLPLDPSAVRRARDAPHRWDRLESGAGLTSKLANAHLLRGRRPIQHRRPEGWYARCAPSSSARQCTVGGARSATATRMRSSQHKCSPSTLLTAHSIAKSQHHVGFRTHHDTCVMMHETSHDRVHDFFDCLPPRPL